MAFPVVFLGISTTGPDPATALGNCRWSIRLYERVMGALT